MLSPFLLLWFFLPSSSFETISKRRSTFLDAVFYKMKGFHIEQCQLVATFPTRSNRIWSQFCINQLHTLLPPCHTASKVSYCFKSVVMKKELQSGDWRDAKREESSFSHLKPQPANSPAFSSWLQQREPAALYSIKESRKRSVMPWPQKTDGRGGVRSRGFLHLKVD